MCSKKELQRHVNRVHLKLKSFLCNDCCKNFGCQNALKSHISIVHEGYRPFDCSFCLTKVTTKKASRLHQIRFHQKNATLTVNVENYENQTK